MQVILQTKLNKDAYPRLKGSEIGEWLIGDWKSLDYIFAGRLAYLAKHLGYKMKLNETFRTKERQAELYARFLKGELKSCAKVGSSSHEYRLAVDVDKSHALYYMTDKEARQFGLCKPLMKSKGEYWHIQPIEANGNSGRLFKSLAPKDLTPELVKKFNFGEATINHIFKFEFAEEFAVGLLNDKHDFSNSTVKYFTEDYKFGKELQEKIKIY